MTLLISKIEILLNNHLEKFIKNVSEKYKIPIKELKITWESINQEDTLLETTQAIMKQSIMTLLAACKIM